ncbi:MAG: hypothetical protein KC646_10845 [Candidatus Cloacimonetes bacterium]|nr:hypothetical protein [Candidatus Cloacimonadota bacterium]
MKYKDSKSLYIDFMLNKLTREGLLKELRNFSEDQREELFALSKMQIFKELYYQEMLG